MIPDKIYVGVGTLSSIKPAEEYAFPGWQENPYSQIRSEEYIRKDALLEWARTEQKKYREDTQFDMGYLRAVNDLIKKLESL